MSIECLPHHDRLPRRRREGAIARTENEMGDCVDSWTPALKRWPACNQPVHKGVESCGLGALSHNGSVGLTRLSPVATIPGNQEERVWPG
jgi:hypothetical protein